MPPHHSLADAVEHYWAVRADAPPAPLRAVLVPNGRPTLQFCLAHPGVRIDPTTGVRTTNADVYLPATTLPLVLEQEGASSYVGVQLTPYGGCLLFSKAPTVPTPLRELASPLPTRDELLNEPSTALDAWLSAARTPKRRDVALLSKAVAAIDPHPADVEVASLARTVAASPSTLLRQFRTAVGLSPKQYIDVMRYRVFTDALLADGDPVGSSLLARLAGYYDQSHATRDFARFTGMTPERFRTALNGIALLMR